MTSLNIIFSRLRFSDQKETKFKRQIMRWLDRYIKGTVKGRLTLHQNDFRLRVAVVISIITYTDGDSAVFNITTRSPESRNPFRDELITILRHQYGCMCVCV